LKYKLIYHIELAVDIVRSGIREFVCDVDGSAFLKREIMEFGVDRYL
jgi:hypothetical protein